MPNYTNLDSFSLANNILGNANGKAEEQDERVPALTSKVNQMYNFGYPDVVATTGTDKVSSLNPFIKRDGSLRNKHINYQNLLNDDSVNSQIKTWIEQATGLTRTPTYKVTVNGYTGSVTPTSSTSSQTGEIKTNTNNPYTGKSWTPVGNKLVDAAGKYLGTPYVWGGETLEEGGLDCSGFVYRALNDAGYNIGRTTAQGYRSYGTSVSKSDMQPGDLIFYGKNGNASHIGIYIGNGQIMHSSGTGSENTASNPGKGVTINNVDYRSDFIEARRY